MADWGNLPFDLLLLIATRIRFVDDYVSFCLVCKPWLKILDFKDDNGSCPSPYPMLMLMGDEFGQREFYNPFNGGGIYKSRLPEIHGKRCWGSSNGWLITVDAEHQIHLFNPLSRRQIQLPRLISYSNMPMEELYNKIIVSDDSSSDELVILAIYSLNSKVASTKPGQKSWMTVQGEPGRDFHFFYDTIYFGGKFYSTGCAYVVICDSNGLFLDIMYLRNNPKSRSVLFATYIVNLGGQIYLINRTSAPVTQAWEHYENPANIRTCLFEVFKFDEEKRRVEKVCNLDNCSIFVGANNTFATSFNDYPECKRNCIYFTDYTYNNIRESPYDTGVYDLADGTIKPLFQEKINFRFKHPVWIKPCW